MTESYTYAIQGWKINNSNKEREISNELHDVAESVYNKDVYNILDEFIIDDLMSGQYLYFGAVLGRLDNKWGDKIDFTISTKLLAEKVSKFNKMCKDYPEIKKIFDFAIENGYTEAKEEQLYIVSHTC